MESIIIGPKTKEEIKIIRDILAEMNISSRVISDKKKEDMGLLLLMRETDRNELVTQEEIMKKLTK